MCNYISHFPFTAMKPSSKTPKFSQFQLYILNLSEMNAILFYGGFHNSLVSDHVTQRLTSYYIEPLFLLSAKQYYFTFDHFTRRVLKNKLN